MGNTVKKQHYVWRKYLSEWTDSGDRLKGKLFVLRKAPKGNQKEIEFYELEKVGFEKFYYDITGFTESDISSLNRLIASMQKKEIVKFGIAPNFFIEAATYRDFIEKRVMCSSENIETTFLFFEKLMAGDLSFYKDTHNQSVLDSLMKYTLDAILYGKKISQNKVIDLIYKFSAEETVDLKYEFNRFFCMQYFRSPRVHTNMKKNIEDFKQSYEAANDLATNFLTNMMMVYFAERMALNITHHFKSSILLYKNQTGVPFITGDTPIVCFTGQEIDGMSIFHYPISPTIAIELIIIPKYSDYATINKNFMMELNQEFVDVVKNCNRKLADNCVNEIYSNTKDSLLKLMEEFEPNNR